MINPSFELISFLLHRQIVSAYLQNGFGPFAYIVGMCEILVPGCNCQHMSYDIRYIHKRQMILLSLKWSFTLLYVQMRSHLNYCMDVLQENQVSAVFSALIEISVHNCQRITSRYLNKNFELRIQYFHIPKVCLFHFAVSFDHLFFNVDHLTNA